MRLATLRTGTGTRAVRVDDGTATEIDAPDVGALLADPDWRRRADRAAGAVHPTAGADLAPVVPRPGKIFCVGLNYRTHIREMGRDVPEFPTLFAKFPEALVGPDDAIRLDPESSCVDWEAELAVVVGRRARRASAEDAAAAVAGFCVINDVTMRDWQYRSTQWLQGKTFEATTPLGPVLVTPEDLPGGVRPELGLQCIVDGETVQRADTGDLVFDPVTLLAYVSRIVTLQPGDVIATGTPGGVGHAHDPRRYLTASSVLQTRIDGLGVQRNEVVAASGVPA
ncbi:Fumarylacetoacetate hydrolase family protein [Pseudonocardia sp. Ae168_Ps1]|uniref:fumarylacetoacetate hydrolase family protein n=1 Tax=unclassified Pseudonocardia TaxID=2619320 RepID=UPI00094ACA09|nr:MULTISPECIES: fumarylacetoacetate hydrolase family protein [unclassified Pseudonocardia]OLL74669.1 Fumarylacetoacetate hydrolase family protein [Pseudonocardia sp. Ae150A_Ps1]OLL80649.1 Fumarylacetoacetate hydrolase family protein [Pseudonocardia sp. Ae168_Ps1]OLL85222.1 Fumarylacetoacetate hydrolase family protein [Pseudonocardia sp. Ae263_Ps1]OLL94753.1 Fumarylacetoacetate hydrolase family protein [Pseudonocardia sp. Ae356_Ps1]